MTDRMIKLDEIIEKSLKAEANKITVPPKEEVWAQILKQLEKEKIVERRKRKKFKLAVASIAVILYIGITPWIFPNSDAKAVGQRLVKIFQSVFGGETKVETISRENTPLPPDQAPPPEEQVPVETVQLPKPTVFASVEEVKKIVPFNFRAPKYIPEGYELQEISYSDFEKESGEVVLRYKYGDSEFKIIEKKLPGDFAMSSTMRSDETTNQKADINGVNGTITSFNNGVNELEYYYLGISIRIHGQIGLQEIIKIGKSLQ